MNDVNALCPFETEQYKRSEHYLIGSWSVSSVLFETHISLEQTRMKAVNWVFNGLDTGNGGK